jgi:beta-1,4-mannosyl-glycoprotein beta-1,4-N-acetylglucosaminyltransferase
MIIDCFTFFNELELLEIRLNYLDPVIDYFVLVEATKTHSGMDKPLYFDENKYQFKPFLKKIVHVIVDDMPILNYTNDRWTLENYQRNCITKGLDYLKPAQDDYILIGDADEIVRKEIVPRKFHGVYDQLCFMYYLNIMNEEHWTGTVGLEYERMINHFGSPQKVRNSRNQLEPIRAGGWHFAWLGGYDRVHQKIKAFAHDEIDNPNVMDNLKTSVGNRCALWCPGGGSIPAIPIDGSFPDYLFNNQDKFKELIYE